MEWEITGGIPLLKNVAATLSTLCRRGASKQGEKLIAEGDEPTPTSS